MKDQYLLASRLLELVDLLDKGGGLTVCEIQERFGIERATANRYLGWLKKHRKMHAERVGRRNAWRVVKVLGKREMVDAAALEFAVASLCELDGTEHFDRLQIMAADARYALPDDDGVRAKFNRLTSTFQVRCAERPTYPDRPKFVRLLLGCIQDRRPCRVSYQKRSDGKTEEYRLEPWGMILYRGRLLLLAGKKSGKGSPDRRMFELDGLRSVEILPKRFPEPSPVQVDYDAIFRDSFGIYTDLQAPSEDIVLHVRDQHAVALRNRSMHPSQQVRDLEAGWVEVRLRVCVCPDLISFVLGMLPSVRVKAPDSLCKAVEAAIR